MADRIKATQEDFRTRFQGMLMQAKRFGVDLNNEANLSFIIHLAEVAAVDTAVKRSLHNIINKDIING